MDSRLRRPDRKHHYYVRDAQGNILAIYDEDNLYKMTKTEWIEYVTVQYQQQYGQEWVLNNVIGPYYGQVGYFKSSFLQQVLANSGYVATAIDAHPVSYYVSASEAVKSNILAHTGGYTDFYNSMRSWSQGNNQPLLGSALYNRLYSDKEMNTSFIDALLRDNIDPEIRKHALKLMCNNADTLFREAVRGIGQPYDTAGCEANADALVSRFVQQPGSGGEFASVVAQLATDPAYQDGYWDFVHSLSLDETVLDYPPYTSTTQQGVLIPYFEEALRTQSNNAAMGSFLDTWTPARALLKSTNDNTTLMQVAYDQSPAAFIGSYATYTGSMAPVYYGLQNIPWLTGVYFLDKFSKIDTIGTIIHEVYENVLASKRISLSSHHLYGSSRLGTKDYLPGQYYMLWDYSGPQTISDTVTLLNRRPWYSMEYNDVAQALALQPWGLTDITSYLVSHQVGQKQYELTNHLGNVQATISDYPYLRNVGEGDTIRLRNPALVSAYDYYPFGMLMPGRYVSDTSSQCQTITQTKWVTTWVDSCYMMPLIATATLGGATTSISNGNLNVIAPASNSGISFELVTVPDVAQDLSFEFNDVLSGTAYIAVSELVAGVQTNIGSMSVSAKGTYTLKVKPKMNGITITVLGPYQVAMKKVCVKVPGLVQQAVLVDVCDEDRDRYRFGFNGQEKVNEWAGIGNFMDYKVRGFDTRVGRFISGDPMANKFPMLTPYQFASNTPIQAIDLDGLEAWFVHGTFSDPTTFTAKTRNDIKNLFNNSVAFSYQWSAENNNEARQNAGERLAELVFANRVSGEKITILGHSHGGNVGIYAVNSLVNKYGVNPADINLLTLNTPVRGDFQLNTDLVNHFNIFNNQDAVQVFGGKYLNGSRKYENAINIRYQDQNPELSGKGVLNHFGTMQINVDVWLPKLANEVHKYPLRYQSPERELNTPKKEDKPKPETSKKSNGSLRSGQAVYGN